MPPVGSGYALDSVQKNSLIEWVDAGSPKGIQSLASPSPTTTPTTSPTPSPTPAPLTLSFAEPTGASITVDAAATIRVSVSGANSGATWNLYRGNSPGATSGGTLLDSNLVASGAGLTYTWNTSGLSLGLYHLYATVFSGTDSFTASLSTPVTIHHTGVPNFNLAFTLPLGATEFNAGSINNITYTASPPSGTTLTYRLDFKQVGGVYAILAQNISTTTHGWNIPATQQPALYRLQLKATDQNNFVNTIESEPFKLNGMSGGVTWTSYNNIQKMSCNGGGCHGQGAGNTNLIDDENAVRTNKSSIISRLNSGSMPKSPATITAENKTIILNYLNGLP